MRPPLSCLPLALLFLVSAVPSNAQKGGGERTQTAVEGAPLAVECELRVEQRAEWRLEGRAPPPDMRASEAPSPGGGLTARLAADAARPHHAGQYACSRAPDAPRVRVRLLPAGDAEPAAAATATATTGGAVYEVSDSTILYYDLVRMNENADFNISLDCSGITTNVSAIITWSKNGTEVEKLPELQGHYQLLPSKNIPGALYTLTGRPREDDYGNYTCALKGQPETRLAWQVRARTVAKLAANTNVVEGQKLKLQCKLVGRPYPPVKWMYSNISEKMENATDVKAVLRERVTVGVGGEPPVEGGELVLEPAAREDAGWYQCSVGAEGHAAVTRLRVKDMYAALWPFLGICAEVFVLCAIILVYEKRRTKPELDDSDTDNHDQKKS